MALTIDDIKIGDKVLVEKELYSYDCYNENYISHLYTVILKIKYIRTEYNDVILDDYSSMKISDLFLINY